MMGLLDKVTEWFNRRSAAQAKQYRQLVLCAANGEAIDPGKLGPALLESGQTVADFKRDLEKCQRRAALRADLKKTDGIDQERKKIAAAVDTAADAVAAAQRKYEETVGPLQERGRQLFALEQAANVARVELLAGCEDPDLLAAKEDLRRRYSEAAERRQGLDRAIRAAEEERAGLLSAAQDGPSNLQQARADAAEKRAQAEAIGRQIADGRAQLATLDKQLFDLQREQAALDLRFIEAP
jgi:chromosome segregation ATPase